MIVDVVMPKTGESITEGTILEWYKKIGDSIISNPVISGGKLYILTENSKIFSFY